MGKEIGLEEDTEPVVEAGPAPKKKRGVGRSSGVGAPAPSETLWLRVPPELKQRLKLQAHSEGMPVSSFVEKILINHEFKQHDEFAWAASMTRIEKAVGQLAHGQRLCMEVLLWFVRMQLANTPPAPETQRELWAELGNKRWNRFLKDMAGEAASELFTTLQSQLKRRSTQR